jgi:hypothetical protein
VREGGSSEDVAVTPHLLPRLLFLLLIVVVAILH